MNLAEILVYTDIKQLHQIADHYGLACNPHSKNELITTLLSNLRHRHNIEQEVNRLTLGELHFLLLLMLDRRTQFSMEDLLAKASMAVDQEQPDRKSASRALIAGGLKRGWIFPAKGKTIGQFQIPTDLREPYLQGWLQKTGRDGALADPPEAYRDEGTAMCDDLMIFLRFLGQEPVPLTADGGMYRRYQSQLFRFFNVAEEPLAPQKWRFGYGLHFDLYPDRFSLIYDYCYYQRWIIEQPGRVELSEQGVQVANAPHEDHLHHELIRFWMRVYKRAIPNLPMLAQAIPVIAAGGWIPQIWLEKTLLPWIKTFYYDEPINILHNRLLKMMVHLGLLKAGQTPEGEWLYAGTDLANVWLRTYNGFAETTILLK